MRCQTATRALILFFAGACLVAPAFGQAAQGQAPAGQGGQAPAGQGAQPPTPKAYIKVTVDELNRYSARFDGAYIQVADYFGELVPADQFPPDLLENRVTPAGYFLFRTQKAIGSNMLCIASRSAKQIADFFQQPLVPESRIYLLGRVGPRVTLGDGQITIFYVESILRGHEPPEAPKTDKKDIKGVTVVLEWEAGATVLKREYSFPEANKRYKIPDPHDPSKDIYLTLRY